MIETYTSLSFLPANYSGIVYLSKTTCTVSVKNNKIHNELAPAVVRDMRLLNNKEVVQHEWYHQGEVHRLDGPAIYSIVDGKIAPATEEFYIEGEFTFEDIYWRHPKVLQYRGQKHIKIMEAILENNP